MQHIKHYSLGLLVVFALLLGALISAQPALAALTGDGTSKNPYKIATADDLIEFAEKVNGGRAGVGGDPDACAVLTANINLEGSEDNQWLRLVLMVLEGILSVLLMAKVLPSAASISTPHPIPEVSLAMSVRAEL